MIKVIKPGGGIYAPVIACDFCGKPINDGNGNFLWNPETDEDEITEVYFTHKGCDNNLEHVLGERGIHTMWMNMDMFVLAIADNTKVDLAKAKKTHKMLKEQGLVS